MKGSFDEFFNLQNLSVNITELYSICVTYCKLMHNFILDRDNIKFNSGMKELERQSSRLFVDVAVMQYYQKRLYANVRGGMNVISRPVSSIVPIMDMIEQMNAMVIEYE